jgi:hypothetical protein
MLNIGKYLSFVNIVLLLYLNGVPIQLLSHNLSAGTYSVVWNAHAASISISYRWSLIQTNEQMLQK